MKRLALFLSALVLVTGCSKIREKLEEKAAEKVAEKAIESSSDGDKSVDLSSSSGGITVKDKKTGAVVRAGEGAKLPDDWPSSRVPIYPGSKVRLAASSPEGKSVQLMSTDKPEAIMAWYKSKMPKPTSNLDMGKMKSLQLNDKDAAIAVMIVGGDSDEGTLISLSFKPKDTK